MKIEEKVTPWPEAEKALGREVRGIVEGQLRQVLLNAYRVIDPGMATLPEEVYQREAAKFRHISTGDFGPEYFRVQTVLAADIAGQIDFPTYLQGYANYAGGLVCALLDGMGRRDAKRTAMVQSLIRSIFADTAVAMHHFFEVEAAEDHRAMEVLGRGLKALAQGDLTHRIGAEAPAKIARAREDYNTATQILHQAMAEIMDAAGEVQGSAQHIASEVDALSRRTEQQAASLDQSSGALREVSTTLAQTSESGRTAAGAASEARDMVTSSAEQMGRTQSAMSEISGSSREIAKIVSVIDTIAMQTNLLALNAGVEAARAGDAGRGFAVVATEVRSLAQRSAEAAKNIRSLMEASARHVAQGNDLVNRTSETLLAARDKVQEIDGLLAGIAKMSQQQTQGVTQVSSAVSNSGALTQQNATMAEETAAEASTLRDGVQRLNGLISQFTLDHGPAQHRRPHRSRAG